MDDIDNNVRNLLESVGIAMPPAEDPVMLLFRACQYGGLALAQDGEE